MGSGMKCPARIASTNRGEALRPEAVLLPATALKPLEKLAYGGSGAHLDESRARKELITSKLRRTTCGDQNGGCRQQRGLDWSCEHHVAVAGTRTLHAGSMHTRTRCHRPGDSAGCTTCASTKLGIPPLERGQKQQTSGSS